MKVATIDNVKVGDEVWIKSKVRFVGTNLIDTEGGRSFYKDGRADRHASSPSLFVSKPEFKPRMMKVWDDGKDLVEREVVSVFRNQYVVKLANNTYVTYKNACEISEPTIKLDIPESKLEAVKKLLAE